MAFFSEVKREFFYARKAFRQYHDGWRYLRERYVSAPVRLRALKGIYHEGGDQSDVSLHVLSCHRDLVLLCYALMSLLNAMKRHVGVIMIHDDGSMTARDRGVLMQFFPQARMVSPDAAKTAAEKMFARCNAIRRFRSMSEQFFLMQKLTDPIACSPSSHIMVVDSDMLWFKTPDELHLALEQGVPHPLMMANNTESYVYFRDGSRLPDPLARLNSGIVLFRRGQFDRDQLESYLTRIDEKDRRNRHFIEQAGYASCLSGVQALPSGQYSIAEAVNEQTVAKHYTSVRRPLFYIEGLPHLYSQDQRLASARPKRGA